MPIKRDHAGLLQALDIGIHRILWRLLGKAAVGMDGVIRTSAEQILFAVNHKPKSREALVGALEALVEFALVQQDSDDPAVIELFTMSLNTALGALYAGAAAGATSLKAV